MFLSLIKEKLKDLLSLFKRQKKPEYSFVFPYSEDKVIKRQQIWDNLQNGLLIEDSGAFIPWNTPFNKLNKYSEQRRNSGGRVNWYFGQHTILDGEEFKLEGMRYDSWPNFYPISEISEFMGFNLEGMARFHYLKNHITHILGEPTVVDLEKFGDFDLGEITWTNNKVRISLIGIEQFACKYHFRIGLIENKNRF